MTANIVQIEFFHVGNKDTLEGLFEECGERIADGLEFVLQGGEASSGIKTVVRFFDNRDILTTLALHAESLRKHDREIMEMFPKATGLRRWWIDRKCRRLARKSLLLKDKAKTLSAQLLCEAMKSSQEVAVERSDHSFRRMIKEEEYELIIAAEMAKSAWLFIFKPNDLLADKNSMIACVM